MGVFSEYQRLYAEHGIATFPINGKKPAVRRYQKITLHASSRIARDFGDAQTIGFNAGVGSKITVVDVDSSDERLWQQIIDRFGDTPIKVRTPSGGLHLWYDHNGETRKVRFEQGLPVDLLGAGVVVAPPSIVLKGSYQFLEGDLSDIARLRPAANSSLIAVAQDRSCQPHQASGKIASGRNDHLFDHLMRHANRLDDLSDLKDLAYEYVENMIDRTAGHPFTDAEIMATVASVRRYTEQGQNRFGREAHSIIPNKTRDRLLQFGSDASYLYMVLKAWSGDKLTFPVANGMHLHMPEGPWSLRRFVRARQALLDGGLIAVVCPATRHAPTEFGWP